MGVEAQSQPMPKKSGPPKRRLRNYLLDPRFQLKYTSMVVGVAIVVAGVLGYFAYEYSKGQTTAMSITMMEADDLDPDVAADLEGWAQAQDTQVLIKILAGIFILAVVLGITGILVTHKLVGPMYKLKFLFRQIEEGKLKLAGRLRKGDELQDVFLSFAAMIEALRENQAQEIAELDAAIQHAKEAGVSDDALSAIADVRTRMQEQLE